MPTYLINHLRIPGDVPNEEGLSYLEKVEATVAPHGGKWLAQGSVDVIEGAWPGSVVLMEFPSRHAAMAWYHSPEYQAIAPLRIRNAISDLILIDSLPDGFTVKSFAEGLRRMLGFEDVHDRPLAERVISARQGGGSAPMEERVALLDSCRYADARREEHFEFRPDPALDLLFSRSDSVEATGRRY